jgi:hypothetical protein
VFHTKTSAATGLTEAQARALAAWWGGRYERKASPGAPGAAGHGVIIFSPGGHDRSVAPSPEVTIFSLEEARELEKFRQAVNPHSPDWVG